MNGVRNTRPARYARDVFCNGCKLRGARTMPSLAPPESWLVLIVYGSGELLCYCPGCRQDGSIQLPGFER